VAGEIPTLKRAAKKKVVKKAARKRPTKKRTPS